MFLPLSTLREFTDNTVFARHDFIHSPFSSSVERTTRKETTRVTQRNHGSLSSFHETSQRNSPLWELLPFQPFLKSYWLTPVQMTGQLSRSMQSHANTDKLRGSIKCGASDNYVRIFSFNLLNKLDYGL